MAGANAAKLTVVCCVDGSELAQRSVAAGLALFGGQVDPVLVTVVAPVDEMLVSGTGLAGGTMSAAEADDVSRAQRADAVALLEAVRGPLGVDAAATRILEGEPGPTLCRYAAEVGAHAIVIGTRGRGGLKRAVLGSVSDFVVRNAPCPVVVTGPTEDRS